MMLGSYTISFHSAWHGCDMKKSSVPKKPTPVLMLNKDPKIAKIEENIISTGLSKMYSEMDKICWTYEGNDYFQTKEEEFTDKWQVVENDPEWELISKEEPVANHQETTKMKLLTEMHNLHGPVLGLSFSEVYPYWMASADLGERICIHDLHHPFQLSKKKRELPEIGSEISTQTTCLKWSKTYPCILASTSNTGVTISSANRGSSAAVKIWVLRYSQDPWHQYGCGASGVLSLSWNTRGQLLASHKNGKISCYNPYQNKILEEMNFVDCDLGLAWTHSDDTVATFSSISGVGLSEIGWLLEDGL